VVVRPNIRRRVLEEFLRCSQRVHTIAFMQWRIKYESNLKRNVNQLYDLIEERMGFMYGRLGEG
jgi:hypothetical protein